jgi:hypothetical protein
MNIIVEWLITLMTVVGNRSTATAVLRESLVTKNGKPSVNCHKIGLTREGEEACFFAARWTDSEPLSRFKEMLVYSTSFVLVLVVAWCQDPFGLY